MYNHKQKMHIQVHSSGSQSAEEDGILISKTEPDELIGSPIISPAHMGSVLSSNESSGRDPGVNLNSLDTQLE